MARPRIKIELDLSDYIIEIIGAIFILLMIGWPMYFFNELPDIIPRHFNAMGEPDAFSQKNAIWAMPALGFFTYISLLLLNKFPHIFNYPKKITEENAERQYRMATKLVRTINMLVAASFFYLSFGTIQTALNQQDGLNPLFVPSLVLVTLGTTGLYMYQAIKKN